MLAKLFRDISASCRIGSPLTYTLLNSAADDLDAGGITGRAMAGSERDRPGTVPGLRFAAALHHVVLDGRAPELATHYPSVGGEPRLATLWPAAEATLKEHEVEVRQLVRANAVQTNEPGRSGPLYGGLLVASERVGGLPVRLLEVGASGGLNLRPHKVAYRLADGTVLGDPDSELQLDPEWTGLPPADLSRPLVLHSRAGCDVNPVDVSTKAGQLHLASFVWADMTQRLERLRAAMRLAQSDPVQVERAPGAEWLERQLAELPEGVLTVVWHSVMWQYASPAERERGRAALAGAAARATGSAPLALLVYEPRRAHGNFELLLKLWPAGLSLRLGHGRGHGLPFTWEERPWG
ncbi:DUF2332 domain-containing protein [Kutzneria kofuensis]|uniref:DUF2332 domain-containing protein n=1 Tax=Kutzneria kofuensis TaxID=103725 RepID=A0A7W9KFE5_9PSEU|nr:DUF2332 domain-containing protein [Kutzneria kofuensis]MBB5891632.1 hypothetical protein [Kutzneria kofuensis]